MAITLVGAAEDNSNNVTTLTLTHGLDIQEDDQILFMLNADNTISNRLTVPTVTAVIRDVDELSGHTWTARKTATASEPDDYVVTFSNGERATLQILVYRGVDTTDPLDSSNSNNGGTNLTGVFSSLTPTVDGCAVVCWIAAQEGNSGSTNSFDTWPATTTERLDESTAGAGSGAKSSGAADVIQTTATAVSGTVNILHGDNTNWGCHVYAFAPAGGDTVMDAANAPYTLTGTAAATLYKRVLVANTASYALTGTAVTTVKGTVLVADTASYSLSGTAVETAKTAHVLVADSASYNITGTAVATLYSRQMVADSVSYALAGTVITTTRNVPIVAASATYTLAGTDVDFKIGMPVASGAYALAGTAVTTLYSQQMVAGSGAYALTGTNVDTLYSEDGNVSMSADTTSYSMTGTAVSTLYSRVLVADSISYTITGTDVGTLYDIILVADTASYSLTGTAVTTAVVSVSADGLLFVSEFLATGGAVTITIYDPVTALEVSTDNSICNENGSTGLYKWDLSKITTTPSSYKEYAYKMTDGSEERAGIVKYDNFFDQYIVTETAEV